MMAVRNVCTLKTTEAVICFIIYNYFIQSLNLSDILCYGPILKVVKIYIYIYIYIYIKDISNLRVQEITRQAMYV